MKRKILSLLTLLALAVFSAACAPQETPAAATDVPTEAATEAPMEPTATSAPTGGAVEDQASLIEALQAAGAEVETGDTVEQAFLTVPGQILKVNGADVQVFEYESAEALEADASQIAPDGGSAGTVMVTWMATPHFFKSGRVLVLYVGDDTAILDLMQDALGEQFAGR